MKRLALPLLSVLSLLAFAGPAHAEFGRTYLSGPHAEPVQPLPKEGATGDVTVSASGDVWLGPSVGFDVFQIDLKTRQYVTGIVPGIGYGLKYKPAGWTMTNAVIAFDVFVQASLIDNSTTVPGAKYFAIEALPIVTLIDWISVGFGMEEFIGVSSLPSELHWVFSFGMKKST
jgi:hypothetical protein